MPKSKKSPAKVLNPLTGRYILATNSTAHNKDLKKLLKKPCTDKRKHRSKVTARCVYKDEFKGKSKFLKLKTKKTKRKSKPKKSKTVKRKSSLKVKSHKSVKPKKKSHKRSRKRSPKKSSRKVSSPRLREKLDALEWLDIGDELIAKQKGVEYWLKRIQKLSKKYRLSERLVKALLNETKSEL